MQVIKANLEHRPTDFEFFYNAGILLMGKIKELLAKGLDWGICHGDLHGANAHFDDDKITHYDFDLCGYGWRAYDLATFKLTKEFIIGQDPDGLAKFDRLWKAFLDGYQSIRRLSLNDIDAIPIFCGIRQLWLMKLSLKDFRDLDIVGSADAEDNYISKEIEYLRKLVSKLRQDA